MRKRGKSSMVLLDEFPAGFHFVAHRNPTWASVPTFMSRWPNLCVSDFNLYVSNHMVADTNFVNARTMSKGLTSI